MHLVLIDGQGRRVLQAGGGVSGVKAATSAGSHDNDPVDDEHADAVRYLPLLATQALLDEELGGERVQHIRWEDGAHFVWKEVALERHCGDSHMCS